MAAEPPIVVAVEFDESPFPGTTEPWVTTASLVQCDSSARVVADGATTITSTTITSATAAFTATDIGRSVSGAGIPAGAQIVAITSATQAVISEAATATASGVVLTVSAVDLASVAAATTEILRLLSGRRYGVRRGTVRPHKLLDHYEDLAGAQPVPSGWPFGFGITGDRLVCDGNTLILDAPASVLGVKVDGVALAVGDWLLYDRRLLVRARGESWPLCQHLDLPDTEPGTWSVTYESGTPVTDSAKLAARAYGCQLVKLLTGATGCVLPERTTTVSRQGVTITRGSLKESLDDGRTGISVVDGWLAAVNPNNLRRRARIAGPDSYVESRPT